MSQLLAVLVLVGCGGAVPSVAQHPVEPPAVTPAPTQRTTNPPVDPTVPPKTPAPTATPEPTPTPTPEPTPTPIEYAKLSQRDWAKIVKAPDSYIGEYYKVWACITQFDAATGLDTFRANASHQNETYWVAGDNSFFVGDQDQLAEFVAGDVLLMNVVALGSFSYDTQAGGNTTVPLFRVDQIPQNQPGACG